ncbi:MAG: DUF7289 family protein [Thermoplasmatota archaeon]
MAKEVSAEGSGAPRRRGGLGHRRGGPAVGAGRARPSSAPPRPLARSPGAVSGAVTAVMLLLIISSVVSIVVMYYVPVWGEADESQHMREALEQFYALRENIDAQVLRESPVSISTKLTLGNEPSALLGFSKTAGRVVSNPFNGSLSVHATEDPADIYARSRGNITFSSQNAYIAQQSYIYEQGAVLVAGSGGAVMRAPPHFSAARELSGNLSLSMLFISLAGDYSSFAGTENVALETRVVSKDWNIYEGADWALGRNMTLNLTTPHPSAWAFYFNETLSNPVANLTAGADYDVTTGEGWVRLDLRAVNRMELCVAVVEVRIR